MNLIVHISSIMNNMNTKFKIIRDLLKEEIKEYKDTATKYLLLKQGKNQQIDRIISTRPFIVVYSTVSKINRTAQP